MKIKILTDDVNVSEKLSSSLTPDEHNKSDEISIIKVDRQFSALKYDYQAEILILLFLSEKNYSQAFQIGKEISLINKAPFIFISRQLSDDDFNKLLLSRPNYQINYPFEPVTLERLIAMIKAKRNRQLTLSKHIQSDSNSKIWLTLKKGEYEGVKIMDIVMVRASDHYLVMKVRNRPKAIVFKGTLTRFFQEELNDYSFFFMLSRSYIINLKLVFRISDNQVFVGEERLTIPKQRKEELIRVLFKH